MPKYEYECMVCGKEIADGDVYHIEGDIGHLYCFQKAITDYIPLKDKIKRRNKQIKNLKTDKDFLQERLNAWEEKYGECEDLTEQL